MYLRVLPRSFFEQLRQTPQEQEMLSQFRVISINSTGESPPFTSTFYRLPTLLVLYFDDVSEFLHENGRFMTLQDARRIMNFVLNQSPDKPILIHCTAGISRSGAVGEVLNDYLNRHLLKHEADDQRFIREHPHILPNPLVRRLLLAEIDKRIQKEGNQC